MNRPNKSGSKIGCLLALMLPLGLAACGAQDGDAVFSDIALPSFSKDRVAREAPVEVRRLLSVDSGLGYGYVSASPAGRYVNDIDWGTGDLLVRDLATGETRRVTNNSGEQNPGNARSAAFSSDGSRIAYLWNTNEGFQLRSIGIDGSDMKVHMSHEQSTYVPWPLDWSKDGRYILVELMDTQRPVFTREDWPRDTQILSVDVATNETLVLKTVKFEQTPSALFFSPDGRFVAFDMPTGEDSQESDIFLVASDGSQKTTTLIQTPASETILGWMPDGSGILFHRIAQDSRAIWKLPLRNGQASGPPELVKDDIWDITRLIGFSDDAYLYGVTVTVPGVHTATYDLETGRVLEALAPVADRSSLGSNRATWSPDGTRIVYASAERGDNESGLSRIIVRSVTGEILQDLPLTLSTQGHFGWTAHGIVAQGRDPDGRRGLFLISLETGEVTALSEPSTGLPGGWFTVSEDGSKLFLGWLGPERAVIEYDIATGRERTLVEQDGYTQVTFEDAPESYIVAAIVAPDGDKIAYLVNRLAQDNPDRNRMGNRSIEIFSRSSGETRVITGLVGPAVARWSRDSRYLILDGRLDETGDHHLLLISAEDGSMLSLAKSPERFRQPSMSPDGRHIAVVTGEVHQEIWRMTFNDRD